MCNLSIFHGCIKTLHNLRERIPSPAVPVFIIALLAGLFTLQETPGLFPPPRLTRQVPSSSSEGDTLQIVLLGDEVSFDCSVESIDVTEVSIWWQKDGVNISSSDSDKYSTEVSKTSEGVVSSQLVVSDIGWEDEGGYSCRARDGNEGRIEKNKATIAVQGDKNILKKYIRTVVELFFILARKLCRN